MKKGRHIITSKIEHHAVLHTCEYLEKHGYELPYLDVDGEGKVSPKALEKAIRPDTILISVMEALDGLPLVKVHCSLLAEKAIHAALWDYAKKRGIVIEGLKEPVSDTDEIAEVQSPSDLF